MTSAARRAGRHATAARVAVRGSAHPAATASRIGPDRRRRRVQDGGSKGSRASRSWIVRSGSVALGDRALVDAMLANFGLLRLLCDAALVDRGLPHRLADLRPGGPGRLPTISVRLTEAAGSHHVALRDLRAAARVAARGTATARTLRTAPAERTAADRAVPTEPPTATDPAGDAAPGTRERSETATQSVAQQTASRGSGRDHRSTYRRRDAAARALGYRSYAHRRAARRTGEGLMPGDTKLTSTR